MKTWHLHHVCKNKICPQSDDRIYFNFLLPFCVRNKLNKCSFIIHPKDVPEQESLATSASRRTAKVSERIRHTNETAKLDRGVFISTESALGWVRVLPVCMVRGEVIRAKTTNIYSTGYIKTLEELQPGRWRMRLKWLYSRRWGRPGQQWKQEGKR